ncbi:YusG family protein [Bacillaceae bacterium IKA-2]|nr:YusG family protein [Bacillaceae bacterium IKA-2]
MEKKTDITAKVQAKFDEASKMSLFLDEKKVGQIIMTNQGNSYEMAEGFEFENDKIFKKDDDRINYPEKYVENCDMGWC